MSKDKKVKEIMVGIFEYPHIPYWFTIAQAIRIVKVSFISTKKYPEPMAVLVFDEKYNLLGTVTMEDILKGIEPKFNTTITEKGQEDESYIDWDTLFDEVSSELVKKSVREIMTPVKHFVEPDDSLIKAAYLMIQHKLILLPVLENKEKLVGLIRMQEIFDEISVKILPQ